MKTSKELNKIEFQELKEMYEHYLADSGEEPRTITDDMVHIFYEGTYFVDEDFFCNINN